MSKGHGEKRSRKWLQAAANVAAFPTVQKAAEATGVHERTLRRWMEEPTFLRQVRRCEREQRAGVLGLVRQCGTQAVATLVRLLGCGQPATECRAALGIMDLIVRGGDLGDVLREIEELKALVQGHVTRSDQAGDGAAAGDAGGAAGGAGSAA